MQVRTLVATVVALSVGIGLLPSISTAQAPNAEAEKQKRAFLATLAKERLDEELAKTKIEEQSSGRQTTKIGFIVIHTDWSVSVNGRFVDPAKRSTFEIPRLDRQADGSRLVTVVATAPITGDIWGEIRTVGKTKVAFTSTAHLEIHGKLKRKPGTKSEFEVQITDWKGSFDEVTIRPDLAGILAGEARKAANKALSDKKETLKTQANRALAKAAAEGRLRLDP